MLPLPEHLQQSLIEIFEYYQHLQADYTEKLEAIKSQIGHLEALQSGGGIAPPPEMVVHLQELEKYYTNALSEISEQVLLAGTQRDRVEVIIGSTPAVATTFGGSDVGDASASQAFSSKELTSVSESEKPGALEVDSRAVSASVEQAVIDVQSESVLETESAIPAIAIEQVVESITPPEIHESVEPAMLVPLSLTLAAVATQPTLPSCHTTVENITVPPQRTKLTPYELLHKFLMSLHPSTRSALNVCKTSGNLYIEERDGVTTLVIIPNDRNLDKRIEQRLEAYQQRFNAFLGKPSSVVHISSVPIAPLLPQYDGLNLEQAIAKLLGDNRGIILRRDYIVRQLYGELPQALKITINRNVSQALKAGVKSKLWDVDPKNADHYTLNYAEVLKLQKAPLDINSTPPGERGSGDGSNTLRAKLTPSELLNKFLFSLHHTTRTTLIQCRVKGKLYIEERDGVLTLVIVPNDQNLEKRIETKIQTYQERLNTFLGKPASVVLVTSIPTAPPLPEYSGLSLKQAIDKLLSANRGIILQIDYIVREIFGEVHLAVRQNTYSSVNQALFEGVKQKLWDVDPDNPEGYTLNYREVVQAAG